MGIGIGAMVTRTVLLAFLAVGAVAVDSGVGPYVSNLDIGITDKMVKSGMDLDSPRDSVEMDPDVVGEADQDPMKVDDDGIPNHYTPVDYADVHEHVLSPRPHTVINMLELPDDFDWRNENGFFKIV